MDRGLLNLVVTIFVILLVFMLYLKVARLHLGQVAIKRSLKRTFSGFASPGSR